MSDFDAARAEWEAVFAQVPDAALLYLKPGDDYALGGLQVHVNWVLTHYSRVLDGIKADPYNQLQPLDPPGESTEVSKRAKGGLTAPERKPTLDEMSRLHRSVREAAAGIAEADGSRKTPAAYGEGEDAAASSPDQGLGWLREPTR